MVSKHWRKMSQRLLATLLLVSLLFTAGLPLARSEARVGRGGAPIGTAGVPLATEVLQELPLQVTTTPPPTILAPADQVPLREGELIVAHRQRQTLSGLELSPAAGDKQLEPSDGISLYLVPPGTSWQAALAALQADPDVLWVEPNYQLFAQLEPAEIDDPKYTEQWGLTEIAAPTTWQTVSPQNAAPITIAVLDTGVDGEHEDLVGRVVTGYNALTGSSQAADDSANSHGTAVAGIAAAATANGVGIAGTAGEFPVQIMPVKVLDAAGVGSMYQVAQGIYWAVDHGATVLNLSLGARLPDYPLTLATAIAYAQNQGVLVVAAAGNDQGEVSGFYPACLPGVVSVGASGPDHLIASFSNSGATTVAPGVNIVSTKRDSSYGQSSGTSLAAPFVSGSAALLWSIAPNKTLTEMTVAVSEGYQSYYVQSHYRRVFNAEKARIKLSSQLPRPQVRLLSPAEDSRISGTVRLQAEVRYLPELASLEFTLADREHEVLTIDSLQSINESGIYTLEWDPNAVADGEYWITMQAKDKSGQEYSAWENVHVIVANQVTSGLSLQIKKPDQAAAAGANVLVFHAERDEAGRYRLQEYEPIYEGQADLQGRVIIPGSLAVAGNSFLVIARGSEPNYLYSQLLQSPGEYVLEQAERVQLSAQTVNGEALAGAAVLLDLLSVQTEAELESSYTAQLAMLQLTASGTGEIWLSPGEYRLRVSSPAASYYLQQAVTVGTTALALDLHPTPEDVAQIRLQAEGELSEIGVLLCGSDGNALQGWERAAGDQLLTLSPGSYVAVIDAQATDLENSTWSIQLTSPTFNAVGGSQKQLPFGGQLQGLIQNASHYPGYWRTGEDWETAWFDARFLDAHGNVLTALTEQAETAAKATAVYPSLRILHGQEQVVTAGRRFIRLPSPDYATEWAVSTAYWEVTGAVAGFYQAEASLAAGPFGPSSEQGLVRSNARQFELRSDLPAASGLTVSLLDAIGQPVTAASVQLMLLVGDAYQLLEEANSDQSGSCAFRDFLPDDDQEYRLAVFGQGKVSAEADGAFFLLVPVQGGGELPAVSVDLRSQQLYRLLLQPRDQLNQPLQHDLVFSISQTLGDGVSAGRALTVTQTEELAIWVTAGNYFVAANSETWGQMQANVATSQLDDALYQLTRAVRVDAGGPTDIPIVLGGDSLAELSLDVAEDATVADRSAYAIGGVAIFAPGQAQTLLLHPHQDQSIYLHSGSYQLMAALVRWHYDGEWDYWLQQTLDLSAGGNSWRLDDRFTASLGLDQAAYPASSLLTSTHRISDGQGNRLVAMGLDLGLGRNFVPSAWPVLPQNHRELAPFLVISTDKGAEIYRKKWVQPDYAAALSAWREGDPILPLGNNTSFFQGEYRVPADLPGGEYQARLELGVGPEGMLTAVQDFEISNAAAAPTLEPLPPICNSVGFNLIGQAAANAQITVYFRVDQGSPELAGTTVAGTDGTFVLFFTPAVDGHYSFTARAEVGGVASLESSPLQVIVDRTPPAAPSELQAQAEDDTHISLSWVASVAGDLQAYLLTRDEQELAVIAATKTSYLDSGLTPNTSYRYTLTARDLAGNLSEVAIVTVSTGETPDRQPPTAPAKPQGFYRAGGVVDLYWQQSSDNIAVVGYRVFRRLAASSDPAVELGFVLADQPLEFRDQGLQAESVYLYTICADDAAGNSSLPSPVLELTTPPLTISSISWRFAADAGRSDLGLIKAEAELSLKLVGERGRQAECVVSYLSRLDEQQNPLATARLVTATLDLDESSLSPGVYLGSFTLPAGAVEVSSLQGRLGDGFGHAALEKAAAKLPLMVAGNLTVQLPALRLAELAGSQLTIWSDTTRQGWSRTVTTDQAVYNFATMIPADDYLLSVRNGRGRQLSVPITVAISAGQTAVLPLVPIPQADLRVQVQDPAGAALSNLLVSFRSLTTQQTTTGYTDHTGWVSAEMSALAGEQVQVTATLAGENRGLPYHDREQGLFTLQPGENRPVIRLRALPTGSVFGRTTLDQTGASLAGVTVTAVVSVGYRSITTTAVSGDDGSYRLQLPVGRAMISASLTRPSLVAAEQSIEQVLENGQLEQNLVLSSHGKADLDVSIWAKYLDREETVITGMNWWTAAHFGLQAVDATGRATRGYPLYLSGRPGDQIKLSIDGAEAGLPRLEQTVELDEQRHADVTFRLEEQGRIIGSVVAADGSELSLNGPFSTLTVTLHSLDEGGRLISSGISQLKEGAYQISVPRAGKYLVKFSYNPTFYDYFNPMRNAQLQTATIGPINVNQYQIRDLGQIRLAASQSSVRGAISSSTELATPGSLLSLRTEFALAENSTTLTMTDAVLNLDLPSGCQLLPGSMSLDGQAVAASGSSAVKVDLGTQQLARDVSHQLHCWIELDQDLSAQELVIPGSLDWLDGNGAARHQDLAAAQIAIASLTITASGTLISRETTLSGRGPAGALVRVYQQNLLLGQAAVSSAGYWQLPVSLPDRGSPHTYRLNAVADWNGSRLQSVDVSITYHPDLPVLTEIVLKQGNGQPVSFRPADGVARFPYVIRPGDGGFLLTLRFNKPDRIKSAEISIPPFSQAAVRQANGDFQALLNFNGHQLGALYLKYETKQDPAELLRETAPSIDQWRQQVPSEFAEFTAEVKPLAPAPPAPNEPLAEWPAGEAAVSRAVEFTLPRRPEIAGRVELTVAHGISYTPSAADLQAAADTGIPVYGFRLLAPSFAGASEDYSIWVEGYIPERYLDTADPAAAGMLLLSRAGFGGAPLDQSELLGAAGVEVVVHVGTKVALRAGPGEALNVYDWVSALKDGFGVPAKLNELSDLLDQATDCGGSSPIYRDQIDAVANRVMAGEATKWGMQLAGCLLGPETFGLGTLLLFGASKAMEYAIDKGVDKSIERIKQEMATDSECKRDNDHDDDDDHDNRDRDRRDRQKKKVAEPQWIWDPSGIVYEAVLGQPLADVTATIYHQDADSGSLLFWDAAWYGQSNPLTTGQNGYYGWDVPPGKWQVVYEKAGYLPAQSALLTVPPPQTDVNVGLESLTPPAVSTVVAAPGGSYLEISFNQYIWVDSLSVGNISLSFTGEDGGELVSGQVLPLTPVPASGDASLLLTKQARFLPDVALTVGQTYRMQISGAVQNYARVAMGNPSSHQLTIPAALPPVGEVSQPRITALDGALAVEWVDPVAENFSQVRLSWAEADSGDLLGTLIVQPGAQRQLISGLSNGRLYQVRLVTLDSLGNASAGVLLTGRPSAPSIDSPGPPAVTPAMAAVTAAKAVAGPGTLTVSWLDPTSPSLRQVKVVWKLSGAEQELGWQLVARGVESYTITGLTDGLTYEVSVIPLDGQGRAAEATVILARLQPGDREQMQLDGQQQTVTGFGRAVLLSIPAGAFSPGVSLNLRQLSGDQPIVAPGLSLVSPIYELDTGGVQPNQPLFLTLQFESELPPSLDLRQLGIYRQDESDPDQWFYLGGVVDAGNRRITVKLQHFSRYAVLASQPTFTDLAGHWARGDVQITAAHQLWEATTGAFQPNRPITRAELASLLVKLVAAAGEDLPTRVVEPFSDVAGDAWYSQAVEQAAALGLIVGSNGRFRPDEWLTRQEMAAMLLRPLQALGLLSVAELIPLPFRDGAAVSPWARSAVTVAWNKGLMAGIGNNLFQPQGTTTRAQAAAIVLRLLERMGAISNLAVQRGTVRYSPLEGGHYQLVDCAGDQDSYLLLPTSVEVERQLQRLVGQTVQVSGLLSGDVSQYMSGRALRAFSVVQSSGG